VPVVDLAVRFGLPQSAITKRSCIVVVEVDLEGEQTVMGILAESVSQVIDLPAGEIEPPPPFGTRVRVDCLLGMGKAGKKFVLLLDIDKVLSADDLLAAADLQDAGTGAEGGLGPAEAGEAASAGGAAV
jgi:purine-binding chemotaxis protein CheW